MGAGAPIDNNSKQILAVACSKPLLPSIVGKVPAAILRELSREAPSYRLTRAQQQHWREPIVALGYLLLFGFGTVVGMILITLILSAPFAFTAINPPKFNWRLRVASGLVSFVFGVVLICGIGFAEGGLFTEASTWEPH